VNDARLNDDFTRFEHAGWERVATKYDAVWASLTRQFIPHLISAAQVAPGMSVLDVACGPGYVSAAVKQLGAVPTGIDFSEKMVTIANKMFPDIRFLRGDAQNLPFETRRGGMAPSDRALLFRGRTRRRCSHSGASGAAIAGKTGGDLRGDRKWN
jgi:SAM-dependent methyltransferase